MAEKFAMLNGTVEGLMVIKSGHTVPAAVTPVVIGGNGFGLLVSTPAVIPKAAETWLTVVKKRKKKALPEEVTQVVMHAVVPELGVKAHPMNLLKTGR